MCGRDSLRLEGTPTPALPRGVCAKRPGLRRHARRLPGWPARACVRARVRVGRGARRGGGREGERRRQAQPLVAEPGAAPRRAWDRRAPAAATRWRDSRPAPRPPAPAADSASCPPGRRFSRALGLSFAKGEEMSAAAASAPERGWKSEKVDEAQALARSCAARRPDFQPCDGLSICATHSHGKCFKLHWCCHLGWCHCKSSRVFPPCAAVLGARWAVRDLGRGSEAAGALGWAGLGCSAAGWGRPGLRAGGSCPRAGRLGLALPWQRDEIPVGSLALVTSTKGDLPVPGKLEAIISFSF